MTGASGQSAPGPVAEDVPQAPKKPALHQRGPSFQSASFCLVLSNQQVTSNQSAVGLVYASHFQVWSSLHAGSPGHLAYPSRLTLNTKDDGRPLLYWDANTALLQIPRYAVSTSLVNHIYH